MDDGDDGELLAPAELDNPNRSILLRLTSSALSGEAIVLRAPLLEVFTLGACCDLFKVVLITMPIELTSSYPCQQERYDSTDEN